MNLRELKELFAESLALIFLVAGVVAPVTWTISSLHYQERIAVLEKENGFLDRRLREPAVFGASQAQLAAAPAPAKASQSGNPPAISAPEQVPLARYPQLANPNAPTKEEVRALARFYGLQQDWPTNPHLRLLGGDISYWHEQGLTEARLKAEFEARRQVLEEAERTGRRIATQGDLSNLAAERVAYLLKR